MIRLDAGRAHAAENLLRGIGAPARAACRHERGVRYHVGRAPRVARRRRLHLPKHLRALGPQVGSLSTAQSME